MNFHVREYQASTSLARYIDCYWYGRFNINEAPGQAFNMVPNGCLELIIHLDDEKCRLPGREGWATTPDYLIIGLITHTQVVRFQGVVPVFTIRFKPEALFRLFNVSSAEVVNSYEDLRSVLDADFRNICNRVREAGTIPEMITLIEQHFFRQLGRSAPEYDYVGRAAEMMRRTNITNIERIAEMVSISPRQLSRKFREIMGVRPKEYLRLVRMNKVMHLLTQHRSLDLTSVAYHCGFFDQAHFIKDFHKVTGINPTLFSKDQEHYIALPGNANRDDDTISIISS